MFKTLFKYAKLKKQPSPLMTAQLIHFDVAAINEQAHATTRDALDGNALVV